MKVRTALIALAVGGAVVLGALAAVPALANPGDGFVAGPGSRGHGPGVMATTMRDRGRSCLLDNTVQSGTLTDEQRATLAFNAEEEKLAHDLYAEFATRYDVPVFDRIAVAESRHLDAVRLLLDRYGITDPTAGQTPGRFTTPAVQSTYDTLLAKGNTSERTALEVGVTVETDDIDQLNAALDGLTAPDVQHVYTMLLNASDHHLAAFSAWLGR